MPQGLGRGLSSLIPKKVNNYTDFNVGSGDNLVLEKAGVLMVDPFKIKPNPRQPRHDFNEDALRDLMDSISEHGIIQPLVVSKSGDAYELIAGERRLRSSQALKLKEVPVLIREVSDQKKLELALVENIQRENLNPIEMAIAYNQLLSEFNLTQEQISKQVGQPRSSIANTLRMLHLPEEMQRALSSGRITEAHAKYLLGISDPKKQWQVFKDIVRHNLTVKDTDAMIKRLGGTKSAKVHMDVRDEERLETIRQFFGNKSEIRRKIHGGQIIINFNNDEELDGMLSKLR
jgi:ParB family transcriptional regulator, chromosome partitioning protein